jgi:hypothetical protein
MCILCGRPGLVHDLGGPQTTWDFAAQAAGLGSGAGGSSAGAVGPAGSDAEVTFISGVTANAQVAAISFGSWAAAGAPATPSYSASWSWTTKWGSTSLSTAGTPGGNVTYWFDAASSWTAAEKTALSSGLALWSAESNIQFSLASSAASADFAFKRGNDGGAYQDFPNSSVSIRQLRLSDSGARDRPHARPRACRPL